MAFVSLVSRKGYLRQEIGQSGQQVAPPDPWYPQEWAPLSPDRRRNGLVDRRGRSRSTEVRAALLYEKLEKRVLPLYYGDRTRSIWMMKRSISKIACYFSSQRMMRRYATEAYLH